ncbi:iron chelate uptake ABC transporter family permease subunit, partial [Enterobacter hormaechei]|uniref:iron chelate uptake ABC transporter family permease subunit n=1 Tax=Enterobacter hormaechei TaxID=158836 RepID=UPI001F0AE0EA
GLIGVKEGASIVVLALVLFFPAVGLVWRPLAGILMALLCGAMLGLAGAAMQSITRNGLADPGLIGVKEGASIVVLALVLFFPAVGLVWRPLAG